MRLADLPSSTWPSSPSAPEMDLAVDSRDGLGMRRDLYEYCGDGEQPMALVAVWH